MNDPSNYEPRALVIGDPHGYFLEQLNIEGIGYICCSGGIQDFKKKTELVVLIKNEISREECVFFKDYLNQGGNLLIINPSSHVCRLFEFNIKGLLNSGYLTCKAKNFPAGFYPIMNAVQLKINREYKSICPLLGENKNSTGYDSIFKIKRGKGHIGVIAFDLFKTFYQITHGHDVTYENSNSPILRVDDGRVIKISEMNVPAADIMRSIVVNMILDFINCPVPKLWYFPEGCRSALCITHDSDNTSNRDIREINEIDKELGISTTTFMSIFNGGIRSWRDFLVNGLDLQFHPVQLYRYHPGRIMNVLQRKIAANKIFLKFQQLFFIAQRFLFHLLANKTTKGVRFHGLQWNKLTDQPLWMSCVKTNFDSTLGSNYYYGYHYGSGKPYFLRHPESYRNLDVLEFPMHLMDSAFVRKYGSKNWIKEYFNKVKRFLNDGINQYFPLVVINLHHYVLLDRLKNIKTSSTKNNDYHEGDLKKEAIDSYSELINYSKQLNIKIESMSYFNDFWRKRWKVRIRQLAWDDKKKELNYQILLNNNKYIYSQILPFKFKKLQLKEIFIDEEKSDFKTILIYNSPYAMFQVKKEPINLNVKARYL